MDLNISRIREMRDATKDIFSLIKNPKPYWDYDRYYFLCTEVDTLITTLNMLEQRAYKESFILLRTVFEKFLYFWLMLEGKRYRWTITYDIQPTISKTPKQARDNTIEHWKKEKESDNPKLKDVIQIQPGIADHEMNVTFESEGLYEQRNVNHCGSLIPIYNFILRDYKPEFVHISSIERLKEGMIASETLIEQIRTQKRYYHNFIYVDKILRNLLINDLITEDQKKKINVHYNFLSKLAHPGIASIEVWENINSTSTPFSLTFQYSEDVYRELIFLYVSRFMYLFLRAFVTHYQTAAGSALCQEYLSLIDELDDLSKDLWFFDNEPTNFDRQHSALGRRGEETSFDGDYYIDPLRRLYDMRNYIM